MIHPRIKSFIYAFSGLRVLLAEEPHARFHLIAATVVTLAGFYLDISNGEWIAIILCIGFVLTAEAFNTAIENLGDAISIKENDFIRKAKDVSAAAVLLAAMTSVTIGIIVFSPYILEALGR